MSYVTPAHQLIFSTVRIEAEGPNGLATGTAFGFNVSLESGIAPFLVTNKHVIEGATEGAFYFTRAASDNPDDGPLIGSRIDVTLSRFDNAWHGHPDPDVDIAVMATGQIIVGLESQGYHPYFHALHPGFLPTAVNLAVSDAIEEVIFIGYPNGIHDEHNLLPIVRRGITATPPDADYAGKPQVLIDAAVFPGSSGSPVFVWEPKGLAPLSPAHRAVGRPLYFLGVLSAGFQMDRQGRIERVEIPTQLVPVPITPHLINLGIVWKASTVVEAIEDALRERGWADPPAPPA